MKKFIQLILTCLLLIGIVNADINSVRVDNRLLDGEHIGEKCEFLEDIDHEWTIDDVKSAKFDERFTKSKKRRLKFSIFSKSRFWIRFKVTNQSNENIKCLLELENPRIYEYEFFYISNGSYLSSKGGTKYPFKMRPINHKTFVIPLDVKPGEHWIYLKIRNIRTLVVIPKLWSPYIFEIHVGKSNIFSGILLGIFLIMLIYNFVIYLSVKDKAYLLLCLLIMAYILVFLSLDGVGIQYIFRSSTTYMRLLDVFVLLFLVSYIVFIRTFLKVRTYTPRIDFLFKLLLIVLLIFILSYFVLPYMIFLRINYFMRLSLLLFYVLAVYSALISARQGYRPSMFYLVAIIINVFFNFVIIFELFNLIPHIVKTYLGAKVGGITFISLMSFALADQINTYKKQLEQTNKTLKVSEENYREIFNASSESIFILDASTGSILDVNNTVVEMYGYEYQDALKQTINDFSIGKSPYSQKEVTFYVDKVVSEGPQLFEWLAKRKNGELFWVEVSLSSTEIGGQGHVIAVVRDIDERKKTQGIMVQTEKMMSIGGLAAGMAHEINNPLASIIQGVQNITRRISPDMTANKEVAESIGIDLSLVIDYLNKREIHLFLKGINEAGIRAAEIVKNMLNFSRQSDALHKSEIINDVLDETIELASHDYDLKKNYDFRKIKIVREYGHDISALKCVKSEIQQVVLNLLKNGAEIMCESEKYQPVFHIRTYQKQNSVFIEVEDNGPGMDEATKKRAFEPFYTTKPVGKGTGLGLSVSYFIITQNHNGNMWVESKEGMGAKFVIELPV